LVRSVREERRPPSGCSRGRLEATAAVLTGRYAASVSTTERLTLYVHECTDCAFRPNKWSARIKPISPWLREEHYRESVRKARVVDEAVPGLALRHHLETPRDNASATSARWGQAGQTHRSSTAAVLTDQCCGTQMRCGSRVPLSRSASWCHISLRGQRRA
jgi:hypothetical protein